MRAWVLLAVLLAAAGIAWLLAGRRGDSTPADLAERADAASSEGADLHGARQPVLAPGAAKPHPPRPPGPPDVASSVPAEARTQDPASAEPVRVVGYVRDERGVPVVGAEVAAPGTTARTTSGEAGRFELEIPPPGAFELVATREGEGVRSLTVHLVSGRRMRGRVLDAMTRAPLPQVLVQARPSATPDAGRPVGSATTNEAGEFSLNLPSGGEHDVTATTAGAITAEAPEGHCDGRVARVRQDGTTVEILLERGLTILGRVLDDRGELVKGSVWTNAIGRTADGALDYTRMHMGTVTEGVLRIGGLAPGRYDVIVRPTSVLSQTTGGFAPAMLTSIEAGTAGVDVRVVRGTWLEGRLVGPEGASLAGHGGSVQATRPGEPAWRAEVRGSVRPDGTFRLGPLAVLDRVDLHVHDVRGHRPHTEREVDPRATGLEIRLSRGGTIAGRVQTADGRPVPAGVQVGLLAVGIEASVPGARRFVATKAAGAFEATGLLEARYELEAGGGTSAYLGAMATDVAPGTTDLVLRVEEGVDLVGQLVDARGAPVAAQSLQADDGKHVIAMRPYAQVGQDGRFRLRGLARGPVRLGFQRGDRWIALGEVSAPAMDVRIVVPD